jgi:hypothetical protein
MDFQENINSEDWEDWYGPGIWLNPDGTITDLNFIDDIGNAEKDLKHEGQPWISYLYGDDKIIEFENGMKVTGGYGIDIKLAHIYHIVLKKCTVELTNGIIINIHVGGRVKIDTKKDTYIIALGNNSGATITRPDGTTFTVPKGAIIDDEGNVTE